MPRTGRRDASAPAPRFGKADFGGVRIVGNEFARMIGGESSRLGQNVRRHITALPCHHGEFAARRFPDNEVLQDAMGAAIDSTSSSMPSATPVLRTLSDEGTSLFKAISVAVMFVSPEMSVLNEESPAPRIGGTGPDGSPRTGCASVERFRRDPERNAICSAVSAQYRLSFWMEAARHAPMGWPLSTARVCGQRL
jgi:hypothetical protein